MSIIYRQVCSYCGENFWRCKCDQFHPPVEIKETFELTAQEIADLRKYFDTVGYISYEFHTPIHTIIARMDSFLKRVM